MIYSYFTQRFIVSHKTKTKFPITYFGNSTCAEMYSESCQTYKVELFEKIVSIFLRLTMNQTEKKTNSQDDHSKETKLNLYNVGVTRTSHRRWI